MIQKEYTIKNYVIYGEDNYSLPVHFVNIESIKTTAPKFNGHIKPHMHSNLFQFIFFFNASGWFKSEKQKFNIEPGSIFSIPENNLHEIKLDTSETIDGLVLTLSHNLLEFLMDELPNGLHFLTENINVLKFNDQTNLKKIKDLTENVNKLLPIDSKKSRVRVNAYLSLLFVELLELETLKKENNEKVIKKNSYSYFRNFQKSLRLTNTISKTVSEYADELRITPTHLNRVCKNIVGLTASQVIQNHIILEAKRHLNYTSHSISEISYLLNFNDLGYFCRFFKKHTGKTPKEYRTTIKS